MDHNILIGIFCLDFEEAKNFYIKNLEFENKYSESEILPNENGRTILTHKITKNFEIEFITPKNLEESSRVGSKGGTINLFTLPTHEIDLLKEKLENTIFFIHYIDTPYASFLTLEDPMGNNICIYQNA